MGRLDAQFDVPADQRAKIEPLPILPEIGEATEYPVDAMPAVMGDAVRATVRKVMLPTSIAANSILAAASLAIQGHFDVVLPTGQKRPTSLFLVTVADSGDRKTTSDTYTAGALRDYENDLEEECHARRFEAANAQAAWDESRKAATQQNKNRGRAALEQAYQDLGPRPEGPLEPTIIIRTGSTEGMLKRFSTTRPSLGLMSDEGGSWLGGYGMSEDKRIHTISTLSDFWDGTPVQTLTSGEGFTLLRGKRLTFHMMVQPIIAAKLLGDAEALGQGFLSRLLVTHPTSIAGTRFHDTSIVPAPGDGLAMHTYSDRLATIIRAPMPMNEESRALEPRDLPLTDEAQASWWAFYNEIEARLGPAGDLQSIKGFVGKLPEQAARLASVMAVFEHGARIAAVDDVSIGRGIALARFYLQEALRLFGKSAPSKMSQQAQALSDWLRDKWKEEFISVTVINQKGPSQLRLGAAAITEIIDVLVFHDHLSDRLPNGATVDGKYARAVWRVQNRG